jgi:hypothetical protein
VKIGKVAQLCKANRHIMLVNVPDEDKKPAQWVGTEQAIYPLYGMRTMDKNQLYTIFDVTEKQASKIAFTELEAEKIAFRLDAHDFTESGIQPLYINITYMGSIYRPFNTSKGIRLVDRCFIMAMTKDVELLTYYERQMSDGKIYIVARLGYLIVGMIAPRFNAGGDKDLAEFASFFADRMEYAQMIAGAEQRARDQRGEDEQLTLVDEDTGEILEDGNADEPDADEEPSQAAAIPFGTEPPRQPDKIVLKLREDDDGGDAA